LFLLRRRREKVGPKGSDEGLMTVAAAMTGGGAIPEAGATPHPALRATFSRRGRRKLVWRRPGFDFRSPAG
jgi:hypothetical protein